MIQFAYLIPLFPLLGFLLNGLFRKSLSKNAVALIGSGSILISFIISLIIFFQVKAANGSIAVINLFEFIKTDAFNISFSFLIDPLSSLFLLIITGVGFLIHVYSTSYMHDEESQHFARYFSYLNLFVFSMLLLVLGNNFVIMFIGWEGVGLCSYLLIGFWFKNNQYNYAARKAFVMNRIGDLGFLLAIFWMIAKLGTVNFSEVFSQTSLLSQTDITAITLLLFVGAMGKSAQIPLFTWLPDAMAGPTPVSALIHAATMVTAGVYMISRSHVLYSLSDFTQSIVAWVGLATAILAATIAMYQNDIKKVLAYSTVSQLGFMFLALGVGAYTTGVFHVMTHAFFKALLFLGAGSVIHAMSGEQDIAKMGGLKKALPITYITFLLGVLAIIGFPFTSGFISKDEILIAVYSKSPIMFYLAAFAAILTAIYMVRLFMLVFMGSFRGTSEQKLHLHESPKSMTIPLIVLGVLSVIAGLVQLPHAFGGHEHFNHFLSNSVPSLFIGDTDLATKEYFLLGVTIVGLLIIYFISKKKFVVETYNPDFSGIKKFFSNKWYIDELYDLLIVHPMQWLSKFFNSVIEIKGIDAIVNSVGKGVKYSSRQIRLLQSGQVGSYVLMMVLGIVLIFIMTFYLR